MTKLIARRRRLALETPLLIGRKPLVVLVEPWGLRLRPKGHLQSLPIIWAQAWNRAAIIAAEQKRAHRTNKGSMEGKTRKRGVEKS